MVLHCLLLNMSGYKTFSLLQYLIPVCPPYSLTTSQLLLNSTSIVHQVFPIGKAPLQYPIWKKMYQSLYNADFIEPIFFSVYQSIFKIFSIDNRKSVHKFKNNIWESPLVLWIWGWDWGKQPPLLSVESF